MKGLKIVPKTKKGQEVLEKFLVEKGKLPYSQRLIYNSTWKTEAKLDEVNGGFKAVYLYCKTRWVTPEATWGTLLLTLTDLGVTTEDYTITMVAENE